MKQMEQNINQPTESQPQAKRGRGRPKGSKNKPKEQQNAQVIQ